MVKYIEVSNVFRAGSEEVPQYLIFIGDNTLVVSGAASDQPTVPTRREVEVKRGSGVTMSINGGIIICCNMSTAESTFICGMRRHFRNAVS